VLTLGISALLLASFGASSNGAGAAPAAADAAVDWIGGELAANGDTLPGFTPGSTDWGLTADAVLSFVASGRGGEPPAESATDRLTDALSTYTTFEPDISGVRIAGATAKVLLVLTSQGRDTSAVGAVGGGGGVDLEAELRSLMITTGPHAGRFADRVPDPTWDASNGFGQALAVLALARTGGGVPTAAIEQLLTQQCPGGGFRLIYSPLAATAVTCVADSASDNDSTALAVQSLLATARTPTTQAALERGVAWLLARQDPATGAFGGSGPTSALNANSTGVIAQSLRAAGQTAASDRAAEWITTALQLTTGASAGAIGYDAAAAATGISAATADQWRRSTSQAVLALGLAPYSPVVGPPVVPPSTTAPTTTPPNSTAPDSTPPNSTPPTTTPPDPSSAEPVRVSPATVGPGGVIPVSGVSGATAVSGARNGSTAGLSTDSTNSTGAPRSADSAGSQLASTGGGSTRVVWLGAGLRCSDP